MRSRLIKILRRLSKTDCANRVFLRRRGERADQWFERKLGLLKLRWLTFWCGAGDGFANFNRIRSRVVPALETLFGVKRPVVSVRIMDALGDTIFELPALEKLRQKYPGWRLEVVAPLAERTGAIHLLKACPFIDSVSTRPGALARIKIDIQDFFHGMRIPNPDSPVGEVPGIGREHLYFQIARLAGVPLDGISFPHFRIPDGAGVALSASSSGTGPSSVSIGFEIFCKGGSRFKQWELERFRELFRRLKEEMPGVRLFSLTVSSYGGFDDLGVINVSGLSVMAMASFMSRLDLVVVLQSGLGALAGALDLNLVQINGGAPLGWCQCLNPRATVVDQAEPWNINSVTVDMVHAHLLRRLGRAPSPRKKYLRVGFLNYDYRPDYHGPSGGHWVNRALVQEGRRRGHDVVAFNPPEAGKVALAFDLLLLGDVYATSREWGNFPASVLERISESGIPYATFDNGYGVCEIFEPPLPCLKVEERTIEAIEKEVPVCGVHLYSGTKTPRSCSLMHARKIYAKAGMTVFMSKLQRDAYEKLFGPGVLRNSFVAGPLSCDPEIFFPDNAVPRKENRYVCVGSVSPIKGYYNVRDEYFGRAGIEVVFAGKMGAAMRKEFERDKKSAKAKVEYVGSVPRMELRKLYSSAKYFVHMPAFPEPFGLGAVEAALCGCEVITNGNVGAATLDYPLNDRARIKAAPGRLWDALEALARREATAAGERK